MEKMYSTDKTCSCKIPRIFSVLDQELEGREILRTVAMEGTLELSIPYFADKKPNL